MNLIYQTLRATILGMTYINLTYSFNIIGPVANFTSYLKSVLRRQLHVSLTNITDALNGRPSVGYESYWHGYVPAGYQPTPATNETQATQSQMMCSSPCPRIFSRYGLVCGRTLGKNLYYHYKSFGSYCELNKENCKKKAWTMAYRGKCGNDVPVFSTDALSILKRKIAIEKLFYKTTQVLSNGSTAPYAGTVPPHYIHYDYYDGLYYKKPYSY